MSESEKERWFCIPDGRKEVEKSKLSLSSYERNVLRAMIVLSSFLSRISR